jgi:hypothetical protein
MAKFIITAESILKKRMSYENIFRTLMQYERFKNLLLNEEQSILIENLPKMKFDEIKEIHDLDQSELANNVHLINLNSQDMINSKLLKIFK